MKIALNTGGGDAPGLNAVVRAVTLASLERGWEVWGIRHGYRGLLDDTPDGLIRLDRDRVCGIGHLGGTILGATNRATPFAYPTLREGVLVPTDRAAELVDRFKRLAFDALVAIGGDGSMRLADRLVACGLPRVIGVPKTIDNDVLGTDVTFGFDTAVSIATEAIDRLHTTAEAHERIMVVEVMGRNAGWIALHAGLAGGADVILIPEVPFRIEAIAEKVASRQARGRHFAIIVVAEGATPAGGTTTTQTNVDAFRPEAQLGGIAEHLARELSAKCRMEARAMVLGHLQRGGTPTTFDRLLGARFGAAAVRELAGNADSGMVGLSNGQMNLVPLTLVAGGTRSVPAGSDTVRTAREIGLCFGDEAPGHFKA